MVPVLSIYMLILLAIIDIFLFVFFLHFITQSIRYEQMIQGVHQRARKSLVHFTENRKAVDHYMEIEGDTIPSNESGYFQVLSTTRLLRIFAKENLTICFLYIQEEYVLKETPLFVLKSTKEVDPDTLKKIFKEIDFTTGRIQTKILIMDFFT